MPARTSLRYSASPVTLRSGLAAAIASTEWVCSRWITPFQLADSANAPWTRTTVGLALGMAVSFGSEGAGRRVQHVDRLFDGGAGSVGRARPASGRRPVGHQEEATQECTSSFPAARGDSTLRAGAGGSCRRSGGLPQPSCEVPP